MEASNTQKGKRPLNYIDAVFRDTSIGYKELPTAMPDRTYWRNIADPNIFFWIYTCVEDAAAVILIALKYF